VKNIFKKNLIALLVYSILTLIFTYPLILHLNSAIYGHEIVGFNYDPYGYMQKFQFVKDYFLAKKMPFLNPYTQPAVDYPGAILTYIFDEVVAFNILILFSFPLAGFFTYLLAYYITKDRIASFFGGLLYAFSPYHWIHAYYHMSISQIQWFPLYLFSLFLFRDTGRIRHGLLLLISLLFLILSSYYYTLLAMVITLLFIIYQGIYLAISKQEREKSLRPFVIILSSITISGIIFISILYKNIHVIYKNLPEFAARYDELFRYGSRPWGFILPPIDNPFLGWIGKDYILSHLEGGTLVEHTLYIGVIPILLSLIALYSWIRGFKGTRGQGFAGASPAPASWNFYLPFLFILIIVSLLFSRPPIMTLFGLKIHMPSHYLYQIIPMFRAYARFGLLVYLAIALLSSAGLSILLKKRRGMLIAGLAFLLLFIEYTNIPPFRINHILPTESHRWIAENSSNALIVDYTREGLSGIPAVRRLLKNNLMAKADLEAYNLFNTSDRRLFGIMKAIGARYAIFPGEMEDFIKEMGIRPYREFRDSFIVAVEDTPEPIILRLYNDFYSHIKMGKEYFRWMGNKGIIVFTNHTDKEIEADLTLTLQSFHIPRDLNIEIGHSDRWYSRYDRRTRRTELDVIIKDPRIWNIRVGPDEGEYTLKNFLFKPGPTAFKIIPYPEAQKVDEALHNGDKRELSVAIKSYEIRIP
jgi:hypothetical protein